MLPTCAVRGYAAATLIAVALAGCASDGSVQLEFLFPADDLSPKSTDVSEITLVTYVPTLDPYAETRQLRTGESLEMGPLPVGSGITIAVEFRAPNERLLAYGRSPTPFEVLASDEITVSIRVRKPFVYVTGGPDLVTYDSTRDRTAIDTDYIGMIPTTRAPQVVIPTNDGADLIVLSANGNAGELSLISTEDHVGSDMPPVPLILQASDAAVSADNRWLVIAHAGAQGGLSIVDLDAAKQGVAQVTVVPLGSVSRVVVGLRATNPRAIALVDKASGPGCPVGGTNSKIIAVSLADPTQIGPTINYGSPVHDIAVSGDGSEVVIADACGDQIEKISLDDDAVRLQLSRVDDPTAIAVFDDRAWAVTTLPPTGSTPRRLQVVGVNLDGTGETRVELPPWQERAKSIDFSGPGQSAEQRMDADTIVALDVAVIPGADYLAITARGEFAAEEVGDFLGAPIIPAMEMTTYEYILVSTTSTNAIIQRVRTACDLTWESDFFNPPFLDRWECTLDSGQDEALTPYLPYHISVLYGSR